MLRGMDIEIIDASEVDRFKRRRPEEEEETAKVDSRLDILDDPVRMYLKQMGQVPLAHPRAGSRDFQAHRGRRERMVK